VLFIAAVSQNHTFTFLLVVILLQNSKANIFSLNLEKFMLWYQSQARMTLSGVVTFAG